MDGVFALIIVNCDEFRRIQPAKFILLKNMKNRKNKNSSWYIAV